MQLSKQNSELKLKVGHEFLYFDVDEFMDNISYIGTVSGQTNIDIVVPKFEFFKAWRTKMEIASTVLFLGPYAVAYLKIVNPCP